jgi:hypothetical protein
MARKNFRELQLIEITNMKTKARKSSAVKFIANGSTRDLSQDDIAFAAYCLWENEGRPNGCDGEHWFRAESLLEKAKQQTQVRT